MSEWTDEDERMRRERRQADAEVAERSARVLGTVVCGPCERTLVTLYATSLGDYWRVIDRRPGPTRSLLTFHPGGPYPDEFPIWCRRHGRGTVSAGEVDDARRDATPRRFRVVLEWGVDGPTIAGP